MAVLTYRLVQGSNLSAAQFDDNTHNLDDRLVVLEALPSAAAGIASVTLDEGTRQLTFIMDDATTRGPVTIPVFVPTFAGAWTPATAYSRGDIITANGSTYIVMLAHTSEAVFDPGETTTDGDYYGLLLTSPAGVLPTGGATGMALVKSSGTDYAVTWAAVGIPTGGTVGQIIKKNSGTDYDVDWDTNDIDGLSDVTITAPAAGDVLQYVGTDGWGNGPISVTAEEVSFTPVTDLAATDVQTAIEELGNEKLATAAIGVTVQAYDQQLSSLIRQNSRSANYTTVLADSGFHILHPAADNNPRTFTIDSNANVAYPLGTAITFVNEINTVTIAITSDTLVFSPSGATGSRTLAANGIATALKITSTKWMISGSGIT